MRAEVPLTDDEGREQVLTVPLDTYGIAYEQFVDYQILERKFLELNTSGKHNEALATLVEALTKICGPHVHMLPQTVEGDNLQAMVDQGYQLNLGDEVTLLRLYAHITVMLRAMDVQDKYAPDVIPASITIEHGGKEFRVIRDRAARIMSGRTLTVGEAIECQEYERRANLAKRGASPKEASILDFTMTLSQVAILLREPGEQLPSDEEERNQWIAERRNLLRSISLRDVIDLRFFLLAAFVRFMRRKNTGSTGKGRRGQGKMRQLRPHSKKNRKGGRRP